MPILVELVFLERIVITICLIFAFVVNIFEEVSIQFPFLCFKPQMISLEIGFVAPYYIFVIF